jgi:hypothetical protein
MRAAAFIVLALSGCGYAPGITIDPGFSAEEQADIVAAADEWCESDAALCLPVSIAESGERATIRSGWPAGVETHDGNFERFAATERQSDAAPGEGVIWVRRTPDEPGAMRRIVRHELGHLLGGSGHIDGPGFVMSADLDDQPQRITIEDLDFVRSGGER